MKVFIIYGTDCNSTTAWLPYINDQLKEKQITCIIPALPTPEGQSYKSWASVLNKYKIESDDIIVGWSTGAIFSVRYLLEQNIKIRKLILISGFNNYQGGYPQVDKINSDFFIETESIAKNVAEQIVCIKRDNDPFISQTALLSFANNLNARIVNIAGGGHFNKAAGYTTFKNLLDIILK